MLIQRRFPMLREYEQARYQKALPSVLSPRSQNKARLNSSMQEGFSSVTSPPKKLNEGDDSMMAKKSKTYMANKTTR
jgi:hypothetical protein